MTTSLQAASVGIFLQELLVPDVYTFSTGVNWSGASAVCKVRQTLASSSVIITLTSPTDIAMGTDGTVTVTFTSAHVSSLIAGLSGSGVIDCVITPASGAPVMLFAGTIQVTRTVSR